jgi:trimeric autotransporter adhesin
VQENVPGLAFIKALRPVTYHFSVDKEDELMGIKNRITQAVKAITKPSLPGIAQEDEKDVEGFDVEDNGTEEGKYDIEKTQFTGFLAQDVDKAAQQIGYDFSGVDKTGKIWGLRYGDFVVPLVKAVQELSQQNDDLKKENDELKSRLDKLEAVVFQSQFPSESVELVTAARLEQNIPNPFSNTTTIGYYLPANKGNAYINFYSSNGALLKSVKLAGSGKGTINVNANELPSGVYQYGLMIDGKVIENKQMVQGK